MLSGGRPQSETFENPCLHSSFKNMTCITALHVLVQLRTNLGMNVCVYVRTATVFLLTCMFFQSNRSVCEQFSVCLLTFISFKSRITRLLTDDFHDMKLKFLPQHVQSGCEGILAVA